MAYESEECQKSSGVDDEKTLKCKAEYFCMKAERRSTDMIISASRRCDIPSFYSDWLINRIREGFVYVRNPMNYHQVSKISLSPDVIDGIVFWTKNPAPMIEKLDLIKDYMFYFQFTVTAYGKDIESNVPSKNDVIVPSFIELSKKIGPERVIWRYDPIMITERYTADYHIRYFDALAKRFSGYTKKCVISFVDMYRNTQSRMKPSVIKNLNDDEMMDIAMRLSEIAGKYRICLESCAEKIDLKKCGIRHGHCIDKNLFEKLLGKKLSLGLDKNQREACGCLESVDIGAYDACNNGCRYCYATHSDKTLKRNLLLHDPMSPILIGKIEEGDVIKEKAMKSNIINQMNIFD